MKKIILVLSTLLAVNIAQAETRIVKVNDYKVIEETFYYKDKLGKEEIVVKTVEYGDNQLKTLIETSQKALTSSQALDTTTYKQDLTDKAQADLTKYQGLLNTLNK